MGIPHPLLQMLNISIYKQLTPRKIVYFRHISHRVMVLLYNYVMPVVCKTYQFLLGLVKMVPEHLATLHLPNFFATVQWNFIKKVWKEMWSNSDIRTVLLHSYSAKSNEFTRPRKLWCNLHRLRPGHGVASSKTKIIFIYFKTQ